MDIGKLLKTVDGVMAVVDSLKGGKQEPQPSETGLTENAPPVGLGVQIETRLTNVMVAALKEAFDRDHARLEMERTHAEEQRRHAEALMRMELRRQVADREIGRLRFLAGGALAGWIFSVVLLVPRLDTVSAVSNIVLVAGWLLLLGSLGSALSAQGRISAQEPESENHSDTSTAGAAAVWLLLAGLALSALSMLF